MNVTDRRHFDSTAYARPAGAFTMVEMLAVMFIITMLLAIGVPAALRYGVQARARATQTIINTVNGAIQQFYKEHHVYPETDPDSDDDDLLQCLTGYRPATTDDDEHYGYKDDKGDGKDGYGYRMQPRGRVNGPWNGTEKLARSGEHFVDSYGTVIEYHPFRIANGNYADSEVNTYAKDASGRYYRRDYVLRSKGEDGQFADSAAGAVATSDDITNFFEE